jgi:L-alanine-DL-glutamate epimerase-like enolase superfamily enzyme
MDVAAGLRSEPYPLVDGMITAPARPGIGLEWDEANVARHRLT